MKLMAVAALSFTISHSCSGPGGKKLTFPDYPEMKIGFSTQNFMNAMPFDAESITELIHYASEQGYQFIELRDNQAQLTPEACKMLAKEGADAGIGLIYEINLNLLHPDFPDVFERALENAVQLGEPGILRAGIALSEFADDPDKVGWTADELEEASLMAEDCAERAADKGVTFIVENIIEPFFGSPPGYYGLNDLFDRTVLVGLQFDLCNAFVTGSRMQAQPDQVAGFLGTLGNRWVTTHVKTSVDGIAQPVLGESPLSIPRVVDLMGTGGVHYFSLELVALESRESCMANHDKSIRYLQDLGILKRR